MERCCPEMECLKTREFLRFAVGNRLQPMGEESVSRDEGMEKARKEGEGGRLFLPCRNMDRQCYVQVASDQVSDFRNTFPQRPKPICIISRLRIDQSRGLTLLAAPKQVSRSL